MRVLIDLLLAVGTLVMLGLVLLDAVEAVEADAHRKMLEAEARQLYEAMDRFHQRYGSFPDAHGEGGFELDTLEPLQRRGYYRNHLTGLIRGQRLDAYDSPDDRGLNQEFWLEMTLADDPAIRYVVARSDDAPVSGGKWLDGVHVCRDGLLEAL